MGTPQLMGRAGCAEPTSSDMKAKLWRHMRTIGPAFAPLWSFACYPPSTSGPVVSVIEEVTTLITTASAALAGPAAMVVTDNGDVLLLDAMLARILVISPDGTIKRTIGSEGAGPGEFRRPRGLAVHADTIRVVDQGNGRMQLFSVAGEHLGSAPIPGGAGGGPLSLRADGWLAVGTRGRDSTLAAYFDETATRRGVLGIPLVPPSALWDFVAIKNQIAQGEVPSVLRNVARPIFAHEGGFWLMFAADPLIHRYRSDNELAWAVTVEVPEVDTIMGTFFERNHREPNPNAFYPLSYFTDAVDVGGHLWLLLNVPDDIPSVVLVIDAAGSVAHRLVFSSVRGASVLAVDPERRRVYLAMRSDATLIAAAFPEGM